jgi:hypothetical protein
MRGLKEKYKIDDIEVFSKKEDPFETIFSILNGPGIENISLYEIMEGSTNVYLDEGFEVGSNFDINNIEANKNCPISMPIMNNIYLNSKKFDHSINAIYFSLKEYFDEKEIKFKKRIKYEIQRLSYLNSVENEKDFYKEILDRLNNGKLSNEIIQNLIGEIINYENNN